MKLTPTLLTFICSSIAFVGCSGSNFSSAGNLVKKEEKKSTPIAKKGGGQADTDDVLIGGNSGKNGELNGNGDDSILSANETKKIETPIQDDSGSTGKLIKANLNVSRQADTAGWTNCLKIQINGGPEIDMGCNHGSIVPTVTADALAKPKCNVLRMILYSNGKKNRTTESTENVAMDFHITKTSPNTFQVQCNDNRDNDFNDLNLTISSSDANLSIENTGFKCEP